jgi:FKBP-type peptidyl-prolyl cis-trans isomerase SlyD
MIIKRNVVADIYYQLKDEDGNIVDSNEGYSPLQYLHGYNNILPALQEVLEGLSAHEVRYIILKPEQSYGTYNGALVCEVDRNELAHVTELREGSLVQSEDGQELTITALTNERVTLDGNHPLAGKTLHVFVQVAAVREATNEEIAQGHPVASKSTCCGPKGCC